MLRPLDDEEELDEMPMEAVEGLMSEAPPEPTEQDDRELAREFLLQQHLNKYRNSVSFQAKAAELNKRFFG